MCAGIRDSYSRLCGTVKYVISALTERHSRYDRRCLEIDCCLLLLCDDVGNVDLLHREPLDPRTHHQTRVHLLDADHDRCGHPRYGRINLRLDNAGVASRTGAINTAFDGLEAVEHVVCPVDGFALIPDAIDDSSEDSEELGE